MPKLWTLHIFCIRKGTSVHYLIYNEHSRERLTKTILKIKSSKGTHTNSWRNQVNGAIEEVNYFILIVCKNNIQWLDKSVKRQKTNILSQPDSSNHDVGLFMKRLELDMINK